jgi:cytosine/adenosine deaminase-related metal-dependent hydrolase
VVISLVGMRFHVRVGILPHERDLAQPLEIDLSVTRVPDASGVLDYRRLYAVAAKHVKREPLEYLEELGWLGDDVWLAHCVHLNDDEIARFGDTQTGVAHCPSSNGRLGAGMAPVAGLVAAGAPVGLGVDGAASNESGEITFEMRVALLSARVRSGPTALSTRDALALATINGARCLGREEHIGSLEIGKLADIAMWRVDDLGHAGIDDPVAAFVLGPLRPVDTLLVGGRRVVAGGRPITVDIRDVTRDVVSAGKKLEDRCR